MFPDINDCFSIQIPEVSFLKFVIVDTLDDQIWGCQCTSSDSKNYKVGYIYYFNTYELLNRVTIKNNYTITYTHKINNYKNKEDFKIITECNCNSNHIHNKRGCITGMCPCINPKRKVVKV